MKTPHTAVISYKDTSIVENNLQSWLNGLIIGLAIKPFPIKPKQTPVAYLYNGVRLPKLPDTDLPYAMIVHNGSSSESRTYWAYLSADKVTKLAAFQCHIAAPYVEYRLPSGGCEWELLTESTEDNKTVGSRIITWANHDIPYSNSSDIEIYGSDPVPVYE